jgi:hypothetical protein
MFWQIFDIGSIILSSVGWYKTGWYYGHIKGRNFQRDLDRHPNNQISE